MGHGLGRGRLLPRGRGQGHARHRPAGCLPDRRPPRVKRRCRRACSAAWRRRLGGEDLYKPRVASAPTSCAIVRGLSSRVLEPRAGKALWAAASLILAAALIGSSSRQSDGEVRRSDGDGASRLFPRSCSTRAACRAHAFYGTSKRALALRFIALECSVRRRFLCRTSTPRQVQLSRSQRTSRHHDRLRDSAKTCSREPGKSCPIGRSRRSC